MPNTPPLRGWTAVESPFHKGELIVQDRVGVRARVDGIARRAGIRDYMPDQHRLFFAERPFLLIGAVDAAGQPWPTILVRQPGFITTPDAQTMNIAATPPSHSPLHEQLRVGTFLGTLGIQFTTGRRNRANGIITSLDDQSMVLAVHQSYGNCRKYIQAREPSLVDDAASGAVAALPDASRLSAEDQNLLHHADTFFIATAYFNSDDKLSQGADVSHRGGRPGFIRIDDDRTLTVPDFTGNFLFNTIGNLMCNPRVGLLFIDFESADLLYVAGEARIIWDGPDVAAFAGAQRLLQFRLNTIRRVSNALPIRWSPVRYSENLASTGIWQQADTYKEAGVENNEAAAEAAETNGV
jgi:predicted pyridoxine 5'-phosphate oxidase superfamily flavin-nucleotide-binding protein